jgi:hypothetical protein
MARTVAARYKDEMSDIINLRQARKAKARREKEAAAEQNRARFGRTKAEKLRDDKSKIRMDQSIDAFRRVARIEEPEDSQD